MITTASLLLASSFSGGKFGISSPASSFILEDLDFERSGKEIPPATQEVGAEIGTGVMGGNIANLNGSYLYNGLTILGEAGFGGSADDIGEDIASAFTALPFNITAGQPILLTNYGGKQNHENWTTGNFKAVSLVGCTSVTTAGQG